MDINGATYGEIIEGNGAGLWELLDCEEYESLVDQVKILFSKSVVSENGEKPEMFFEDSPENEKELETFVQSVVEKTACVLQRYYRQKHRNRQTQGIAAAKARGIKVGRPEKELPENFKLILEEQTCGRISIETAASLCGMSVSTFMRRKKKLTEMPMTNLQENKSSKKIGSEIIKPSISI